MKNNASRKYCFVDMIRVYRVRYFVLQLIVCLLATTVVAEPVRLAVIAEGNSVECRNLADLIQVELSKRDDLELVEREEIDRVLAEQALTASALVAESQRVRLGAILRAKGLLFVGQTNPTNGVFQVRLVETRHGFVAGFIVHEATTPLPQTQAAVDRAIANLSLPPDEQVGVSMLVINNGLPGNLKTRPIVQEFMEGIEQRVMVELTSIPGILILERRKLGDVAREDGLEGHASSLMAGTLIIDGGLNLAADLTTEKDDPQVVLTLRLRNLATGAEKIVKVEGGLLNLRLLEQKALAELGEVAMAMRAEAGTGTLKSEVKVLDELALRYQLPWAGEAAVSLDASDKKRVRTHVEMLTSGLANLPDDRAKAITLAKIETLCREHHIALMSALRCDFDRTALNYLKRAETFANSELYQLLQPLRTALFSELEHAATQWGSDRAFDNCVEWLPAVVRLPSERRKRLLMWFDEVQANPKTSDSMKYFLSTYLLHVYRWKVSDLHRFKNSDDPVLRFYANKFLLRQARSREDRIAYSNAMMADLEAFLDRTKGLSIQWHFFHTAPRVGSSGKRYTPNHWPGESMRELYLYRPEFKEAVQRKLFERMKGLLEEGDFRAIAVLDYDLMLTTIPECELFGWMNGVIDHRTQCSNTESLISDLVRWRAEILDRHPEFGKTAPLKERVLFSAQQDGIRLNELAKPPAKPYSDAKPYLRRFLVEEDTLWVGISSFPVALQTPKWKLHNLIGLWEIDLQTGRLKSAQCRWFPRSSETTAAVSPFDLISIQRIGDFLAVLHPKVGVVAVPADAKGMDDCHVLGFDEGLPINDFHDSTGFHGSLVGMRHGICLGLKQWIIYWDFDTWKSHVLLDVEDPASGLGYDDKGKYIGGLRSNPLTDELWLVLNVVIKVNKTGTFIGMKANPKNFYCRGLSGTWGEIEKTDLPPRPEHGQKLDRARQILKESLVADVQDVAIWRDKIIVLYGSNDDWKLSEFSMVEDGGEDGK